MNVCRPAVLRSRVHRTAGATCRPVLYSLGSTTRENAQTHCWGEVQLGLCNAWAQCREGHRSTRPPCSKAASFGLRLQRRARRRILSNSTGESLGAPSPPARNRPLHPHGQGSTGLHGQDSCRSIDKTHAAPWTKLTRRHGRNPLEGIRPWRECSSARLLHSRPPRQHSRRYSLGREARRRAKPETLVA